LHNEPTKFNVCDQNIDFGLMIAGLLINAFKKATRVFTI